MDIMKYYKIILLSVLSMTAVSVSQPLQKKTEQVKVQDYYESLCGYCVYYLATNITNVVKKLGSSVDLHLYPFGNARFTDANRTQVECQHGETECYGNILHACAIDQLKTVDKYIDFLACVMLKGSDDEAVDDCAKDGINGKAIKDCANSQKGEDLLAMYGRETYKVRPGQKYTPYTLINGKELDIINGAQLMQTVCATFKKPPPACKDVLASMHKIIKNVQ